MTVRAAKLEIGFRWINKCHASWKLHSRQSEYSLRVWEHSCSFFYANILKNKTNICRKQSNKNYFQRIYLEVNISHPNFFFFGGGVILYIRKPVGGLWACNLKLRCFIINKQSVLVNYEKTKPTKLNISATLMSVIQRTML